jgi:hypothetical protein
MKKFTILSLVAIVLAISLSSCKSHEKCPAYSKVEHNAKKSI